jgi:uncharacterized membrane protein YdfJ with MMPL/SSD domain
VRQAAVRGAAIWVVLAVGLGIVSHRLGDNTNDNLSLPGTDSQHATDTLQRSFPTQANGTSPIVLHAHSGKLTDSKYANAVNTAVADVAKAPDVASVVNPRRVRLRQSMPGSTPTTNSTRRWGHGTTTTGS